MPAFPRPVGPLLLCALLFFTSLGLAACDSPAERAESHYQRGMALLAEGDTDRALLEFRNVFRLNGEHIKARLEYARIERERGETRDALGQYLRIVDQDPTNVVALRAVAELALDAGDFATAEENTTAAAKLAPADPAIRALKATLDFRHPETRQAAIDMARGVLVDAPDTVLAHMVLIADRLNAGAPAEAIPLIEAGLRSAPADENLHMARLAALEQLGNTAETGAELRRMAELFPSNDGVTQALIQWYLREKDPDGAEAVLRATAAKTPDDPKAALAVAQFLLETRGADAAIAELDTRIATAADPTPFQRARAGLDFTQGRTDQAIATLRGLLVGAEPSDSTRDLQVSLAEMLAESADKSSDRTAEASRNGIAEASALLGTVIAGDGNNIAALKLRAKMAIDADNPAQAIQDMRTASTSAPRDPEIMTIMALAHERDGSRDLASERLAMAVEASNQAPGESLRYARFLMQDERAGPAEGVIVDALRRAPENPELLLMLGQIHLDRHDWARAAQVAAILRKQGSPTADAMAASLETASLQGQGRAAEVITSLEGMAGPDGADAQAMASLMQSYVAAGDLDAAQAYLDGVLSKDPANLAGRLMRAGLDQVRGDPAAAEALYRAVIADAPALPQAHQAYYAFLMRQGRPDEAAAALDAGISAAPEDATLLFTKAGLLESRGDVDGAITAYETLYARDSASQILANNLASLIATYRDDPASLERAFNIARRLRGSDVPYFQDTYGWILHRRGDDAQALDYLGPAAKALPDNALVQFHLAETEWALKQVVEARASYARALAAVEAGSPLPQAETVRARLAEIDAHPATPPLPPKG